MSYSGWYYDCEGDYEPNDTLYTLLVNCPPRPLNPLIPKFFDTHTRVSYKNYSPETSFRIRDVDDKPNYDCFEERHLADMKVKTVKIKAKYFPADLRCDHVQGKDRACDKGCYVLEKGGDIRRFRCKAQNCEGHVYVGKVKEDKFGDKCFGKKGERMVCVEK